MDSKLHNITAIKKPTLDYGHSAVWIFDFPQQTKDNLSERKAFKQKCIDELIASELWTKDKKNKPYIKDYSLSMSISHSQHYLAVGFSEKANFGIDIEENRTWTKLVRKVMNQSEQQFLKETTNADDYFFATWCIKEAVYKAYNELSIFKDIELLSPTLSESIPIAILGRETAAQVLKKDYYFCLFAE